MQKDRWDHPLLPEEGVESLNHLLERSKRAITEISQEHMGEKVAIFTHNTFIRTLIIDAQNMDTDRIDKIPNCAVVHFLFDHKNTEHPLKYIKTENLLE